VGTVGVEATMSDPMERERARELQRRRENELKDLEVEDRHEERPLEGLAGGPTTWTQGQDDAEAERVHGGDEQASRSASEAQVPLPSADHTLPEE
jgi:hypothetical protein